MGRRSRYQRTSPFEDIIMLASRLPWWGSLLLGLISFLALHTIASRHAIPKTMAPGQIGEGFVHGLITTLAMFGQLIVPIAFIFAAIVSAINAHRRKKEGFVTPNHLDAAPRFGKRVTAERSVKDSHPGSLGVVPQDLQHEPPEYLAALFEESSDIEPLPQSWSESVLQIIEWKRFEVVCREFLKMTGHEAHETNVGADGGVDIRVTKPGDEVFRGIVQCKAWNAFRAGVKPVRELYGVKVAEKAKAAMLITSGMFTAEAEEFAKGKVKLVSGRKFVELIRKLTSEKQQGLLEIALEGDFRTPTCPRCDIKMVLRKSQNGKNSSGQFWGCSRYPRCKQTLVYKPH